MNRSPVPVLTTVLICLLVTASLPLSFFPAGGPNGFDRAATAGVHDVLDDRPGVYRVLVTPSDAWFLLPVVLIGVLWYVRTDRWRAGFLLLAPELTVLVNEALLKPAWHRHLKNYLAYPSGHTVQFVAIATALVLAATTRRLRLIVGSVAAVAMTGVAIGMIGLGYHYPTDILGGAAAAVGLVTGQWMVVRGRFAPSDQCE